MIVIYVSCNPKYGDIYYADLSGTQGSEQGGVRPVLIIQNDIGNRFSPTTIALAITSKMYKSNLPTHVIIEPQESGLQMTSVVLAEQIRTVDRCRLRSKVGQLDKCQMKKVSRAMLISCHLENETAIQEMTPILVAV